MSEFLEIVSKADDGRVWRVLDEFMDALKEARPEVYNDLVHSLQRLQYRDVSEQQELLIILG